MISRLGLNRFFLAALLALVVRPALAITTFSHVTDGQFTSGAEWSGPNVAKVSFAANSATGAGGADLYAEQVGSTLYLMYDYFSHPASSTALSFFDVFFSVPSENTDYLVRIMNGGFQAYEKAHDVQAPHDSLAANGGAFDPTDPQWSALDAGDLALARFQSAIGVGRSPGESTSDPTHLMAEFQLSIQSGGNPDSGIYSPEPAFWSASEGEFVPVASVFTIVDPPISSGIFTLNPDGTTTIVKALDANGDPVPQPQEAVSAPEAASWAIWLLPMVGLVMISGIRSFRHR